MFSLENMPDPIYLDHHATTPADPRVLEAMWPYFREVFGNASSRSHLFGRRARDAVEAARLEVATWIGAASADEIVFTSGATESDGLALLGAAGRPGAHVITQATEHRAVLQACGELERRGARVTRLPVDSEGRVAPEAVAAAIETDTVLVSIMLANNEIGTVQDIHGIGALTRERDVLFHCDAAQGLGYVPLSVEDAGVDLLSISGHKIYGPKGVGALYVRRGARARLARESHGGGQQGGIRSGTLNVPGIVGLARAAAIMREEGADEAARLAALRERLYSGLRARVEEISLNGPPLIPGARHPGNLNLRFLHVPAAGVLVDVFDELAISAGSACSSDRAGPSHVLLAIGLSEDEAKSSLRFGLGRDTTEADVYRVVELLASVVERRREASPLWQMHLRGEPVDW